MNELKEIWELAKGKRGIVYTASYKGKKIALKKKNPKSTAIARIEIEAQFLKKLNEYGIGPKFIFFRDDEVGMEFIDGEKFESYILGNDKKNILKVNEELFSQLYQMDKLGINKEEMHHPFKHIIVREDKPILIDFERCHYTEKPKNVTQFVQYIMKLCEVLKEKGIAVDRDALMKKGSEYSKNMTMKAIKNIISSLQYQK